MDKINPWSRHQRWLDNWVLGRENMQGAAGAEQQDRIYSVTTLSSSTMKKINLQEKFSLFHQHWTPKIIGSLNDQHIKLAKVKDDFVWHDHQEEDELFIVFKGTLYIDFRDGRTETIGPGEILIVPKGVEHRPWTKDGEEVWLMLIEPQSTKHTGTVVHEKTQTDLEWI